MRCLPDPLTWCASTLQIKHAAGYGKWWAVSDMGYVLLLYVLHCMQE